MTQHSNLNGVQAGAGVGIRRCGIAVFVGLTLLAAHAPAVAQSDSQQSAVISQLIDKAQYWEARGRFDLARESWERVLRADSTNADALSALGSIEARAGRPAAAQDYLEQLKRAHPNSQQTRDLQIAVTQSSIDEEVLDEARALAQAGEYDQSVALYREIFGGTAPEGRLALEYYQTLAGAENGWDEARRGLTKLAADYENVPIYQLALAQHLTYREATRREGISMLAELADDSIVGRQATDAWRQALIWLSPKPGDNRYFQAYLNKHGQDAEIREKIIVAQQAVQRQAQAAVNPLDSLVADAYAALNDGQLNLALTQFEEVLRVEPDNSDGLGGIGIVMLRQERFDEAATFLRRAMQADPSSARRWREALDSAEFWSIVRRGDAARTAGQTEQAIALLEQAISIRPDEYSVRNTLGDLYAQSDNLDLAEQQFRTSVQANSRDVDALRGLIGVLTRRGDTEGALALAQSLPESMQSQLGNLGALKSQFLRDRAQAAIDAGDDATAEQYLKEALLLDPSEPYVRMDLARVYQRMGRTRDANTLIDGLLETNPKLADALFVKATLLAENQNWYEALRVLERVPLYSRQDYMNDLQHRLWVRYQTERAAVFSRFGRPQQAVELLRQVEPLVGDSPELLGALASALAETGESRQALGYIRQALSRQSPPEPGLRLQYASLLFKLRQDAEFELQVDDLNNTAGLTQQQRQDLARLQIAHNLRKADLIRESGDLATAYEYLEPMLRVNPNDPRLLMALARLYQDAGEFQRTLQLYNRVINLDPENLDAYKGAVNAHLALDQLREAELLLNTALELDPTNPRLYALAGRLARRSGNDGQALEFFRQALALDASREQSDLAGETLPGGADNWRHAPTLYLIDPNQYQSSQQFGAIDPVEPLVPSTEESALALRQSDGDRFVELPEPYPSGTRARAWPAQYTPDPYQRPDPRYVSQADPYAAQPAQRAAPVQARPIVPKYYDQTYGPAYGQSSTAYQSQSPPSGSPQAGGYSRPRASAGGALVSGAQIAQTQPQGYGGAGQARAAVPYQQYQPAAQPRQSRPANPGAYSRQAIPVPRSASPGWFETTITRPEAAPVYAQPQAYQFTAQPQPQSRPVVPGGAPARAQRVITPQPAERLRYDPQFSAPAYEILPPQPVAPGNIPPATVIYDYPDTVVQPAPRRALPAQPAVVVQPAPRQAQPRPRRQVRVAPEPDPRDDLLREIAEIESLRSPFAAVGLSLRNRDGQDGLGSLFDLELPAELSVAKRGAGRFRVRAVPVLLNAGNLEGASLPQFGTLPIFFAENDIDPLTSPLSFEQNDAGVVVQGIYEVGQVRLDVGTTPIGFREEDIQGGLRWQPRANNLVWNLDLSRRSVEDSLLSYAGARDPGLNIDFGGVMKTGGRLDLAYDGGPFGAYINGSYHYLDGNNVKDNSVIEAGGGFYARLYESDDSQVTWGVNATTFFYEENLRRYTLGHGGYFSPQFYLSLGVPVEWLGRSGRLSYRLNAAVGIQAFEEDAQDVFPTSPALQQRLGTALAANPQDNIDARYPGQSVTGLGVNFTGEAEYLLAPQLSIGGRVGFDNARDFNQYLMLGFLRYWFRPQAQASLPPSILQPDWVGDPTRP